MVGAFCLFTVATCIELFLTQMISLPEQYISPLLVLFRLGIVTGNPKGSKLADRNTSLALRFPQLSRLPA